MQAEAKTASPQGGRIRPDDKVPNRKGLSVAGYKCEPESGGIAVGAPLRGQKKSDLFFIANALNLFKQASLARVRLSRADFHLFKQVVLFFYQTRRLFKQVADPKIHFSALKC